MKPSQALKELGSTADVKAFEKMLKSYTAETARPADTGEGGVNVSKWELAKVKRDVKRANAKAAARKAKERKVFIEGKEVTDVRKMGRDLEDKKPLKVNTQKSAGDWKKFADYVEKISTDYYEDVEQPGNFKDNLKAAFFSHGPADPVLWALYDTIPAGRLRDMYYENAESCNIEYVYDDNIDNDDKQQIIRGELGTEIKSSNLADKALEKMLTAAGVSAEEQELLPELYNELGHDYILDQYLEFGDENIFDLDYVLELYLDEFVAHESAALWDMWKTAGLDNLTLYKMYKNGVDITDRNIILDGIE